MKPKKRKQPKPRHRIDFKFLDIVFENCEMFRVKENDGVIQFYKSGHIKSIFIEKLSNLNNISNYPYDSQEKVYQRLLNGNDITQLYFVKNKHNEKHVFVSYVEGNPYTLGAPNLIQTTKLIKNGIEFSWERGEGISWKHREEEEDSLYGCWDLILPHNIYEKIKDKINHESYGNIIINNKK